MVLRSFREIQTQSVRKEGSCFGMAVVGDLYVVGRLWQGHIPARESDTESREPKGTRRTRLQRQRGVGVRVIRNGQPGLPVPLESQLWAVLNRLFPR
jgi:hypothetical protein